MKRLSLVLTTRVWALAVVVVVGGVVGGACNFDTGGANGIGGSDGGDLDGGPDGDLVDAGADAPPIDAACASRCVSEDELETCAPGGGTQIVECPLGCFAEENRCRQLVPSNGATDGDLAGVTAGLEVPALATVTIDTDTGEITSGLAVLRDPGTGVVDGISFRKPNTGPVVLGVGDLSVAATGTLSAVGSRTLVILARGDIVVRGVVDASAVCESAGIGQPDYRCGGPGGGNGSGEEGFSKGCANGVDGTSSATLPETGGGGGGFGQDGASGGTIGVTGGGSGGLVGPTNCGAPTLVPLFGGSGGGQGGGDGNLLGGEGGGGGGGLQLTSLTHIIVEKTGANVAAVVAQGGGGKGGGPSLGGGGGGSGGAILLEAPVVTLTGAVVAANGGSGGQGNGFEDGVPGNASTIRAEGAGEGDGRGGDGGAKSGPAEAGFGSVNVAFDGSGGGGGGAGRIRVNAEELESTGGTVISPAESVGSPATK